MNAPHVPSAREINPMGLRERTVWVTLVTIPCAAIVYLAVVLSRAASMPADEVSWIVPLLWAMAVSIVTTIAGVIVATIGSAINAGAHGADMERFEHELGTEDARDREIDRHGEYRARSVTAFTAIGVIVLAMFRADPFWIATALYAGAVVGTVYGGIVKVVAYRKGF